jgi:hypothetical protein
MLNISQTYGLPRPVIGIALLYVIPLLLAPVLLPLNPYLQLRRATGWMAGLRFRTGATFSLLYSIQTGCVAYPISHPVGTVYSFPGVNVVGT